MPGLPRRRLTSSVTSGSVSVLADHHVQGSVAERQVGDVCQARRKTLASPLIRMAGWQRGGYAIPEAFSQGFTTAFAVATGLTLARRAPTGLPITSVR